MQPSREFRLAAGMNDPAPANPSRRYRSTHLRPVRGQTPAACATASGVCPFATCRTIRSRPRGVSRAFLVHVHPVLPRNLKLQQPQLPRSEPDGQPTESSQLDHLTHDHRQQGPRDRSLARTDYEIIEVYRERDEWRARPPQAPLHSISLASIACAHGARRHDGRCGSCERDNALTRVPLPIRCSSAARA